MPAGSSPSTAIPGWEIADRQSKTNVLTIWPASRGPFSFPALSAAKLKASGTGQFLMGFLVHLYWYGCCMCWRAVSADPVFLPAKSKDW
jgi:hypothetical protein